jgi:hypothetical protein
MQWSLRECSKDFKSAVLCIFEKLTAFSEI